MPVIQNTMHSVEEADRLIRDAMPRPETVRVPLRAATGLVLAEALIADRAYPPFDRVMLDGIALHSRDETVFRSRGLPVGGMVRAGETPAPLPGGKCMETMTGAALPAGADCIVPVEELEWIETNGSRRALGTADASVLPGRAVHVAGSDCRAGETVVSPGRRVGAAEAGIAASFGYAELKVFRPLRTALFGTGNELVEPKKDPGIYGTRCSNLYAMAAGLDDCGLATSPPRLLSDDRNAIANAIRKAVEEEGARMVILSGGVSAGKFDFVPAALGDAGFSVRIAGVRQRPGKPMHFATHPSGAVAFGMPGNPLSALACLARYVIPAVGHAFGKAPDPFPVIVAKPVNQPDGWVRFLPVHRESFSGVNSKKPVSVSSPGNSGDFASLADTCGFVAVDSRLAEGETGIFSCYLFSRIF